MALLRADLWLCANLVGTAPGRRVLFGTLLGLGLLGAMSHWTFASLLEQPQWLRLLHQTTDGDPLRGMLLLALGPCPIAASWLGLSLAQRQLFAAPELDLWRAAPLPAWRPALQVWLRAVATSWLWATALAGPGLWLVLQRAGAPWPAVVLLPVALAAATVPLLSALLAAQLLLVRFCSGRWLRYALAAAAGTASLGFSLWLVLGFTASQGPRGLDPVPLATAAARQPWTLSSAAELLAAACRSDGPAGSSSMLAALARVGGWLLGATLGFWLFAHLHPRAVENYQRSGGNRAGRRRARSPGPQLWRTVLAKELGQVLHQPGALLGLLLYGAMVLALAQQRVGIAGLLELRGVPADLRQLGALLVLWFLAVLLALYGHLGRFAAADAAQWPLLAAAPAPNSPLLSGKLLAVGLLLAWPLLLVALAGGARLGATPPVLLRYLLFAVPGTLLALGALAVVGTHPPLLRPQLAGQASPGRNLGGALLLVLLFELLVAPLAAGGFWCGERLRSASPAEAQRLLTLAAGTAWVYALAVLVLCLWLARWQFARLRQPT
jgi:hypothetical protein